MTSCGRYVLEDWVVEEREEGSLGDLYRVRGFLTEVSIRIEKWRKCNYNVLHLRGLAKIIKRNQYQKSFINKSFL